MASSEYVSLGLLLVLVISQVSLCSAYNDKPVLTPKPLIGILSQPSPTYAPGHAQSYIGASYVKFVEMGGNSRQMISFSVARPIARKIPKKKNSFFLHELSTFHYVQVISGNSCRYDGVIPWRVQERA